MTHDELVLRAGIWLRNNQGCPVVFCEPTVPTDEVPDAIGFKHGLSILIECKASRADALSEPRKPWRKWSDGMGNERYFMMPLGLARELAGWVPTAFNDHGLLGVKGRSVTPLLGSRTRELCQTASREERYILERSFHRMQSGRRFITKTGRFEHWNDFTERQRSG